MSIPRKALIVLYAAIALLALVGTWGNNLQYLGLGIVGTNVAFWSDTFANPASRSVTADLFFLVWAIAVWMVLEARRLQLRGVWLYIVFGAAVAISVTLPLFLIHREKLLARAEMPDSAGRMTTGDLVGLALLGAITIAYAAATLFWRPS